MDDHSTADQGARRLARLLITTPDESDCERCLDALESYVAAQLTGAPIDDELADVARHLDQCVGCAEAYAVLYEAQLHAAAQPRVAVPPPNLSFLPTARPTAQQLADRLRSALADAIEQVGATLRLRLSQPLLALLTPTPTPGLAVRSAGPDDERLFDLVLDAPSAAIERVQLSAYRSRERTDRCDLRVQLALPGREWPDLAEIPIMLRLPDQQRRGVTDAWGEVVFADLADADLPQLAIEIAATPDDAQP